MTKRDEILPLGSVVRLRDAHRDVMIVSRYTLAKDELGNEHRFDYGACLWPEGVIGGELVFFNVDGISEVIQRGYDDGPDGLELCVENLISKAHEEDSRD
jgi:hypothetical protein